MFPYAALGTEDSQLHDLRTGIAVNVIKYIFKRGRGVWQFGF